MSYLIVFNIIFIFFLLDNFTKKNEVVYKAVLYILLCVFLCFSYFNGSDWRSYENQYYMYNLNNYLTYPFEKGYSFYSSIFKFMDIEFFNYFIFTKILCFLSFIWILKKYSVNIYFSLMIFFSQLGIYLFIDCPLRALISISIFFIGIYYFEKNIIYYYIFLIFAYFFHKSSSVFFILPILWFFYKKIENKIILLFFTFGLIFIFSLDKFIYLAVEQLNYFPMLHSLKWRLYNYLGSELVNGEIMNIRLMEKMLIVLIGIWNKEKIERNFKYGKLILFLSIIFIGLYRIGITLPILVRVALYVRIFYIILLTYLFKIFKSKIIKTLFVMGYYFYSLASVYLITQDMRYKPYTTYIKYIFQEKPNYFHRDNYNKNYYERNYKK